MKSKYFFISLVFIFLTLAAKAQDSAKVADSFKELLLICKNVDFGDPKVQELGLFYKAAPFIVYQGDDEKRKWKTPANYNNSKEKEQVNNICYKINETVNQDSSYQIIKYLTQNESEGKWHVLLINYVRKGKERKAVYAFLKIDDKFLLGDID
jgi:hypothetical protein